MEPGSGGLLAEGSTRHYKPFDIPRLLGTWGNWPREWATVTGPGDPRASGTPDPGRPVHPGHQKNARAACPDPVEIAIRCTPCDLEGRPCGWPCATTAPGWGHIRPQVFEPFFTTGTKGTGLTRPAPIRSVGSSQDADVRPESTADDPNPTAQRNVRRSGAAAACLKIAGRSRPLHGQARAGKATARSPTPPGAGETGRNSRRPSGPRLPVGREAIRVGVLGRVDQHLGRGQPLRVVHDHEPRHTRGRRRLWGWTRAVSARNGHGRASRDGRTYASCTWETSSSD